MKGRHVEAWNCTQRGATMVSVMLLSVSLITIGLLAVRSSVREVTQAGQLVARERALMVAQAAVDLATTQYLNLGRLELNASLAGYNPQGSCANPCGDCIPDAADVVTGQRNEVIAGEPIACAGRPCMRQGAVSVLPTLNDGNQAWCDVAFRDLVSGGDAEARVSVWVRNNAADALGYSGSGDWLTDADGRVVVTGMATVRNTTVTVEQEVLLAFDDGLAIAQPQSPDEGYGGGHNNDNSTVTVCTDDYESAQSASP
jgi:hypothetical protein